MKVPQFSVLAVKANKFHTGLVLMDVSTAWKISADTIRYFVHIVKKGYILPDGIPYLPGFMPRLMQHRSSSENYLAAIMDAVCTESLAVEKASIEAPEASERAKKPELRTLAALPHQVDCDSFAEWPARSSRKSGIVGAFIASVDSWGFEK